jgi:hypothetical protein
VTEPQSPFNAFLDVLVYAPVGLALTVADELPKLAARGRAQLATARVVGEFAVAQGRRELNKRLATPSPSGPEKTPEGGGRTGSRPGPGSGDINFDDLVSASEGEVGQSGEGDAGATSSADGDDGEEPDVAGEDLGDDLTPVGLGSAHSPSSLAIPGYDSLAASQVIQRLDGLSAEELAAVGAYESAHRARRTILTRVRQLQEG